MAGRIVAWFAERRGGAVRRRGGSRRRRELRCPRDAAHRRHAGAGTGGGRRALRRRGRPRMGRSSLRGQARARPDEAAQDHGAVRQPAPGRGLPGTRRSLDPQAGGGVRSGHHDRARTHLAASISASRAASRRRRTASAAASTRWSTRRGRSAASAASPSSWRASARAGCARSTRRMSWNPPCCGARRWSGLAAAEYPDVAAVTPVRRQRRHAAGARAQAVRRDRDHQHVRRHPVRLRRHAHRIHRHAAVGVAGRREGRARALYEPVHGSAPDIAGKATRPILSPHCCRASR